MFRARVGVNGGCRQVNGSTIPESWRKAADLIRRSSGLTVILGDVDAGKSTLSTYLANVCLENRVRTGVIDGDVGQADIGPPTTTSSSRVTDHIYSLQELRPECSYFIGDTSPASIPDKLLRSITSLNEKLSTKTDAVILNTDGWLREDEAVEHKLKLLDSLRPSLVLGLELDHELDPILNHEDYTTLRLEASRFAKTRTRAERKRAREEGYRRFLQNARDIDTRLDTITFRTFNTPKQQRIDQASTHRGTLAGVLDENGMLASIGRIVRIANGLVRITTNARETPRIIELGAVVLSSRFNEIGFEN